MTPLLYMIYNVRSYVRNSVRCHSATVYGARQFTQEHFLYREKVYTTFLDCELINLTVEKMIMSRSAVDFLSFQSDSFMQSYIYYVIVHNVMVVMYIDQVNTCIVNASFKRLLAIC